VNWQRDAAATRRRGRLRYGAGRQAVVRAALVETVFLRGARPPRAQFSAPSRKTSNARNRFKSGFPHRAPSAGCEAQPATPGAGVLPIAGEFGVAVGDGTFEAAHGETHFL